MYSFKQYAKIEELEYDVVVEKAEYQGREVKLNDPFRLPSGSKKKFGVYVKNDKGNIVKVTLTMLPLSFLTYTANLLFEPVGRRNGSLSFTSRP